MRTSSSREPIHGPGTAEKVHSGKRRSTRVLVAGLGNFLLADEGVGVHAVRALRKRAPRGVAAVEVGTAVLDSIHLFENADRVIAIDAVQAGGAPGTIYRFRAGDMENRPVKGSLHEGTLLSALQFAGKPRPEIVIFGVEPETIDYGLALSPSVRSAVPRLIREIEHALESWEDTV